LIVLPILALTLKIRCRNSIAMSQPAFQNRVYARDEIFLDGVIHITATIAAIVGSVYLLTQSVDNGGGKLAGLVVYLAALLAMLGCSAAYNLTPVSPTKWLLRRLDHSAIYVMIAATYTPLLLWLPDQRLAMLLAAIVWIGAAIGVSIKVILPGRYDKLAVAMYLALGWVGIFAASSFFAVLPRMTMLLIIAGGFLYSAGVPFYLWEKLKFQNAIWHMFVVAAAATHFAAIASLYL
jgi:hemolysin III